MMSDLNMFYDKGYDYISFLLFQFTLVRNLRNFNFESHWNTLIFFNKKYMTSDLNMSNVKMADFVSFPLLGFNLVMKLRFYFEIHWNTLIFFDKKRYGIRFEYVPWKNVWFCFISIVCIHCNHIKLRNFNFESHWNTLMFCNKINGVTYDYVLSNCAWLGSNFVVWVEFWQ